MNKKKLTTICIIIIFLLIIPNVNAISVNKKTNENKQNPKPLGMIYGQVVHYPYEIMGYSLGFALVKIENKFDISSPILGYYCIDGLETDKEYIIQYSHRLYKTQYREVFLSSEHPICELELQFYQNDKKSLERNNQDLSIETDKNKETSSTGRIYGYTGFCHWPGYSAEPFVRVWIGTKFTRSNLYGEFSINGLPVDRYYTVYYTRWDFVTKSEEVFLSSDEPNEEVYLMFNENDIRKNRQKTSESNKPNCFGSVYGQVRYSPNGYYGDMPTYYTLVKIGKKFDIVSFLDGSYKISGLEIDKTYTLYYYNPKFKTKTAIVTLTKENPNVELYLFYYSGDERRTRTRNI